MNNNIIRKACLLTVIASIGAGLLSGCSGISSLNIPKELKESMNNNGFSGNPSDYIQLGEYKGLDIEKGSHEVTSEELQDELDTLLSAYTTYEEVADGVVASGDKTNIDYEGKLNGVAFDGGTAQGSTLEIGSHTFINGFEDGLVGVKVGETVELPLTFPENYQNADLAGKDVIFTVTVNSISRPNVPEMNDEFIAKVSNGQYSDLDSFMVALEEQIKAEYDEQYNLQYYTDIWNAAVDNAVEIKDIPNDFLSEKSARILLNTRSYAESYGVSFDDFLSQYMGISSDEYYAQAAEYSKKAAKESLVLWAIADAEGISVTEEELTKACQEYVDLGVYESVEAAKADADYKYMYDYILLSKVQDFLVENAAK